MVEKSPLKETNFVVNLGIVFNKEGKVLVIKRKKSEITKTSKEFIWTFSDGRQEKERFKNEEPIAKIKEVDEIEEIKWVKPEELKNYFTTNIDPEVKKILGI